MRSSTIPAAGSGQRAITLGEEVVHDTLAPEAYRQLGFPRADDLGNMFRFKRDCNAAFGAPRDVALGRTLNPALQHFATWLDRNNDRIPRT